MKKTTMLMGSMLFAGLISACDGVAPDTAEDPAATTTVTDQIRAANAGVDESLGLIDRLVLDNGNQMVEFYQPTPGEVLVSAAGRPNVAPVLTEEDLKNTTAADLYARLAPGREIPSRLRDVGPLANVAPIDQPSSAFSSTERVGVPLASKALGNDGLETRQGALTSGYCGTQWFKDFSKQGCSSGGSADYNWCLTDWYGGATATLTNGWASYYNLCPEIGSAVLKISGTAGTSSWSVPQNTYRWFQRVHYSYSCGFLGLGRCQDKFNEKGEVLNASTTTFNYMGWFLWK
jgi:hypothetical protein